MVASMLLSVQRSEEERAELRARSAASVVNIDPQERTRRVTLGAGIVVSHSSGPVYQSPGCLFMVHPMTHKPIKGFKRTIAYQRSKKKMPVDFTVPA
jgi:2-keto-3-deoxy-6-phosphogluconate aldolase